MPAASRRPEGFEGENERVMPAELIPSRGAVAEPLLLEVERDLTPADIARLAEAPRSAVPVLKKLRSVHHRQAQLVAAGRTHKEISIIVGCTTQRIVQLLIDPMFQELVAYYREMIASQTVSDAARIADKIIDVGEMAIDELHERLEDDGRRSKMSDDNLRKISEFAMDRTVAPPKTAVAPISPPANITINFGTPVKREVTVDATIEAEAAPAPASKQIDQ